MTTFDVDLTRVTTSATAAARERLPRPAKDFAAVAGLWALAVLLAAVFPLEHPQVARVALFIHLMSMAIGFGAVVMIDVYGLMWLFGRRSLAELVDLETAAHCVIAVGIGGLLASGIALHPELSTSAARLKMALVLIVMLNGLAAQRMLQRMRATLPPHTRGDGIPWAAFQRGLAAALISQATWWGCIAIGFITNAQRHG
jgi:hypothetical protein